MNDILNRQLIRGSLFYSKTGWNHLINAGLKAFIKVEENSIERTYVHFSTDPIDHLRVTIKPIFSERKKIEEHFLEFMDNFLAENPSPKTYSGYNFYGNNTAWTDQYDENSIYEKRFNNAEGILIRTAISAAIFVLATDIIDDTSIFTFIFYLQLGVFKAMNPQKKAMPTLIHEVIDFMNEYPEQGKRGFTNVSIQSAKHFFVSNEEMLVEIVTDIWVDNLTSHELGWIADWVSECRKVIDQDNFAKTFVFISTLIFEHLGLKSQRLLPLSVQILLNASENFEKTSIATLSQNSY